jgi:outer membrane protein assembly factor BamB
MGRTITVLGLVLTVAAVFPFPTKAADWPQWRGPNRDAKASGFKAPASWHKELAQKWKVTVGQGDATPSLVGEKVYVFSRQEGNEIIRALDVASGNELWQDKYPTEGASGAASGHSGPRASPTVVDGKVITLGVRGVLSCLDAATGKVLWRKNDYEGVWPRFFTSSSPIVVDGLCIVQVGGPNNGGIVAYDLQSGDERWKWTGDSPAYASPELMTIDGEKLIVAMNAGTIVAIGASDGKLAWESPLGGGPGERGGPPGGGPGDRVREGERAAEGSDQKIPAQEPNKAGEKQEKRGRGRGRGMGGGGGGYNASTPVVDGQTLYYAGAGGGIKAVKLEKEGDKLVAKELWTNPDASLQFNSPVLKDGMLFGLSQANRFFCVNAESGKTGWIAPGGQSGGGGFGGRGGYGSVVDAGKVLLAITPGSELVAIEPTEKEYVELARIKVADSPTYAHLVVAGNRLIVKDQLAVSLLTVE